MFSYNSKMKLSLFCQILKWKLNIFPYTGDECSMYIVVENLTCTHQYLEL